MISPRPTVSSAPRPISIIAARKMNSTMHRARMTFAIASSGSLLIWSMGRISLSGRSGEHRRDDAVRGRRFGHGGHGDERGGGEQDRDDRGGEMLDGAGHLSISDMV